MALRSARCVVLDNRPLAGGSRHLVLAQAPVQPFEVAPRGGQFAIFDTGARQPDGRPLRRCYSFLSAEEERAPLEIAVYPLGPGSRALASSAVGRTLEVGGPYGKLVAEQLPDAGYLDVLATDTGITAALGLVRGAGLAGFLKRVRLTWIRDPKHAPLPGSFVLERLPSELGRLDILDAEAIGRPARAADAVRVWLEAEADHGAGACWLVGDGEVVVPLEAELVARGRDPITLRVECFFHAPSAGRPASAAGRSAW
jgi:ferredoxin-NADP reductase